MEEEKKKKRHWSVRLSLWIVTALILLGTINLINAKAPVIKEYLPNFLFAKQSNAEVVGGASASVDGIGYTLNPDGYIDITNDGNHIGYFGFGVTGTVAGNNYIYTSENFTWTKSEQDNVITLYNNQNNFNWTIIINKNTGKIKHTITNGLGALISNAELWYIFTVNNGTRLSYNRTTVYADGNSSNSFRLSNVNIPLQQIEKLRKVEIADSIYFDFRDLLSNNFVIEDVYIGNASIIGHSDKIIFALGVTKNNGNFPNGATVQLDPLLIPTAFSHAAISVGTFTNSANANVSDDVYATSAGALGNEINQSRFSFLADEGGNITNSSYIQGIDIQMEGKENCGVGKGTYTLNVSVSGNNGTTFKVANNLNHNIVISSAADSYNSWSSGFAPTLDEGGVNIKWNTTELSNNNFKIRFAIVGNCTGTLSVDDVRVKVYWTPPPTLNITNTNLDDGQTQGNIIYHLSVSDITSYINLSNIVHVFPFDWNDTDAPTGTPYFEDYHPSSNELYNVYPAINSTCGIYGNGACFNGSKHIFNDVSTREYFNDSFTISVWEYSNNSGANHNIIEFGTGAGIGNRRDWQLSYGATTNIPTVSFGCVGSSCSGTCSSTSAIPANVWHHLVGTKNTTNLMIFVDGILNNTCSGSGTVQQSQTGTEQLDIGAIFNPTSSVYQQFWKGYLDELMVLDTSLNATQVSSLYNNQTARFYPRGELIFLNQNITINNSINITDQYVEPPNTMINMSIGNLVSGAYVYDTEVRVNSSNILVKTGYNFSRKYIFYSDAFSYLTPVLNQTSFVSSFNDQCNYIQSNWALNCSLNCNIQRNTILDSGGNISIFGNGNVTFNSNITLSNKSNTLFGDKGGSCTVLQNQNYF